MWSLLQIATVQKNEKKQKITNQLKIHMELLTSEAFIKRITRQLSKDIYKDIYIYIYIDI